MKVLFVTSELAPIKKFGGLADYSASLPKALEKLGINVDVCIPFYEDAKTQDLKVYKSLDLLVPFDNETHNVEVHKTKLPDSNVDVIMLKMEREFSGDFLTDSEYFAFFDKCVVEYIKSQFNTYDIVHCNDWHTGLITHILEDEVGATRPKTLVTIHNLGYQGEGSPIVVKEVGIVPGEHPLIDSDIQDGDINMLYQAVTSSDYINTVSKTYAEELKTEEFGQELTDVIQNREARFMGILNGVDYSTLPRDFDTTNFKEKKAEYKQKLIKEFGLSDDMSKPLFAFISRLDPNQKGLDILIDVIYHIVENGGQFILLGTGDKDWEEKLAKLKDDEKLKNNISMNIKFDVALALYIYKASDFFLLPSRYEPCGLTQMMSMWYGSIPIARSTGGLKDSINDGVSGFLFEKYDSEDFKNAVSRAFELYNDKGKFEAMAETDMKEDFDWDNSGQEYKNLYERMINGQ